MSELIEAMRCKPDFYAEYGASATWIKQAERMLGVRFSRDYKECLEEFGSVSFDGHELTGFSADKNLDVVEVTRKNWQKNNMKNNFYVIEETHIDGIVIWQDDAGTVYTTAPNSKPKKIANSLSEYLNV